MTSQRPLGAPTRESTPIEGDAPPVDLDPRDDRFEVEMPRRLNEMAMPGWWDG